MRWTYFGFALAEAQKDSCCNEHARISIVSGYPESHNGSTAEAALIAPDAESARAACYHRYMFYGHLNHAKPTWAPSTTQLGRGHERPLVPNASGPHYGQDRYTAALQQRAA